MGHNTGYVGRLIKCTFIMMNIFYQVMYREGTGHGLGTTGNAWCGGLGKMRNISVGSQVRFSVGSSRIFIVNFKSVWGLNRADEVFVRIGLSKEDTKGKDWTKIEGSMKTIRHGFE